MSRRRIRRAPVEVEQLLAADAGLRKQHEFWSEAGYQCTGGRLWRCKDGRFTARLVCPSTRNDDRAAQRKAARVSRRSQCATDLCEESHHPSAALHRVVGGQSERDRRGIERDVRGSVWGWRMSAVRQLRAVIVERLKAAGLGFKEVKPHIGRYSVDDLKRMHRAAPAAAIGIIGGAKPQRRASGEVQIEIAFAAVIVTDARAAIEADDSAVDLAIAVAASLADFVPARLVRGCQPASTINLEAVAQSEIDMAGLAVWAVTWTHSVLIGTDALASEIDDGHALAADPLVEIGGMP